MSNSSLEKRVTRLEAELASLKAQKPSTPKEVTGWQSIVGVFADNPYFEEAVAIGREYRESLANIADVASTLEDLPNKSSEEYSLYEAVGALKEEIALALSRHYTFPEIAQILTDRGISINTEQLERHYFQISRDQHEPASSASKPRNRRSSRRPLQYPA
jgi:uncharacterized protein YydD (DUF2326 family)